MFKDKLKMLREEAGLTQKELGQKIYVSRSAVCKWEIGNGIPSDVNIEALCNLFNVSEDWLLDREDMKDLVNEYNKKNQKLMLFILGIVVPLVLIILSLFPLFKWYCKDEMCISLYVSPRGIFSILLENNSILVLMAFIIYIYEIIFSILYWKKKFKYDRTIQLIGICLNGLIFVITFIIAIVIGLDKGFSFIFFN